MTRAELLNVAKPIIFNTQMVKAINEGKKTVTRRCVKPKSKNACGYYITTRVSDGEFMGVYDYDENGMSYDNPQTQPAYVGDILYVRETWNTKCANCTEECILPCNTPYYFYKADYNIETEDKWKPSIHMPKEAARIFLRVTGVRVERLQDINGQDVLKEGLNSHVHPKADYFDGNQIEMFEKLWNSTIKKQDIETYGWEANPHVWVIEFEKMLGGQQ